MFNFIKINNFFKLFGYQIISYKKNVYTFVEKYSSYKQALLKSKNEETYVTKNFQKKQNLMRLETLETSDRFCIFPVFFSAILNQNSKKLEFLEVGGGNNPIFLHFLKCNNKKVKFHVLEEKNFKIKVPNKFKNYLIYYNNLKQINFQNLNSIIFSGSIQYMENYQEILSKAFNSKLKYIIITETFFTSKKKNIYTLQNNMEKVKFPNIFFSFQLLNKTFIRNNYDLIYCSKRKVNKYKHNILNNRDFCVRDLIYKLN